MKKTRSHHLVFDNKNQTKIQNVLTFFLILVTIASVIATIKIGSISQSLEKARHREDILSRIDYTNKLLIEVRQNKQFMENFNNSLDSQYNSSGMIVDTTSIVRLELVNDFIDNTSISNHGSLILSRFKIIKSQMAAADDAYRYGGDIDKKDDNLKRVKDNVNIMLTDRTSPYYLDTFIGELEQYTVYLESQLTKQSIIY